MKKLAIVAGARPQFIKLAPLLDALKNKAELTVIHTGQHYDFEMSDIFFDQLDLPKVEYHLGVGSSSPASQVGRIMIKLEEVFDVESFSMLVVIGDTNSTLGGALAAAKNNIPLVHVEAGLRSRNKNLPEQINRVVTDRISEVLCCPDQTSVKNLNNEGITEGVFLTGDILYDLVDKIKPNGEYRKQLLKELGLTEGEFILMTMHRAENVDNPGFLKNIIDGLAKLPHEVLLPLHPRTEKNLVEFKLYDLLAGHGHIRITKPVGVLESLALIQSSLGVITDSGGIQREASYFGKKAYILRDETEWLELEAYGAVHCIGDNIGSTEFDWNPSEVPRDYFQKASPKIADAILGE